MKMFESSYKAYSDLNEKSIFSYKGHSEINRVCSSHKGHDALLKDIQKTIKGVESFHNEHSELIKKGTLCSSCALQACTPAKLSTFYVILIYFSISKIFLVNICGFKVNSTHSTK